MTDRSTMLLRWLATTTAVVVVGGLLVLGWQAWRGPREPIDTAFKEGAEDAGIRFHMSFLPGEQGQTFKINLYDHGSGLAVGDFDGDGHDDIYFVNQLGPNALYRNKGDGTFEDVTAQAGVALGDRVCVAASFADFDNDGRLDLFVTSTRGGNVLFKNLGEGKFEDVTQKAGLVHIGHSQTPLFFDYDNDGYLDLFVTGTARWTTDSFDKDSSYWIGKGSGAGGIMFSPKEHNIFYRNNHDGTFTDVTKAVGLEGRGWAGDAVPFDYDGDGRLDLFVTSMFGRCQLYRNNSDGTFTDVTLDVLGRTPWGAVGARVFDFDNDGRLDLFVVDMHSDMWMGPDHKHDSLGEAVRFKSKKFPYYSGPRADRFPRMVVEEGLTAQMLGYRQEEVLFGNALYRNEGGGKFSEVSDSARLETFWPWGIATGDFDNDGFEDAFLPSGMGYPFYYWPNALLMNQGDGTFQDRAAELGVEPPPRGHFLPDPIVKKPAARSSRAAVTADFDSDGRLEIVTNNFNDHPYYFRNHFPKKNWVAFRLRGTRSNPDALGAVVRLYSGRDVFTRPVLGACGYLAQSSHTVHIGLGDRTAIDRVEITWPGGRRQQLPGFALNTRHDIVEPEGTP